MFPIPEQTPVASLQLPMVPLHLDPSRHGIPCFSSPDQSPSSPCGSQGFLHTRTHLGMASRDSYPRTNPRRLLFFLRAKFALKPVVQSPSLPLIFFPLSAATLNLYSISRFFMAMRRNIFHDISSYFSLYHSHLFGVSRAENVKRPSARAQCATVRSTARAVHSHPLACARSARPFARLRAQCVTVCSPVRATEKVRARESLRANVPNAAAAHPGDGVRPSERAI